MKMSFRASVNLIPRQPMNGFASLRSPTQRAILSPPTSSVRMMTGSDGHALHDARVVAVLLLLARQRVPRDEEVLGAEEPDAARPVIDDVLDLVRVLDVRRELDLVPVERHGGIIAQREELLLELAVPHLRLAVDVHRFGRRMQNDVPRDPVDDELVVRFHVLADIVEADDRGNALRAREDRGVRRAPARVRDESEDVFLVESGRIGRRQRLRDDDRLLPQIRDPLVLLPHEIPDDAPAHVADILAALLEIFVLDVGECREHLVENEAQRVRRVDLLLLDHLDRFAPDELVLEYHPVRIEDLPVLLADLLLERADELLQLLLRPRESVPVPLDLGVDPAGGDVLLVDGQILDVDDERLAEGDARRGGNAAEGHLFVLGLRVVH